MPASRRLEVVAAALALIAIVAAPAFAGAHGGPRLLFRIQPTEIDESSSLVVSQIDPGLVYTANDSGGTATVYVLDAATGGLVGETSIAGVEPVDIEAMTVGPHNSLIVADIGDNDSARPYVTVYRIAQPDRGDRTVPADSVRLTYADGPHDAESAVYDAASGRLFVISKAFVDARVYRSPRDLFTRQHAVMRPVVSAPAASTDAALLPGADVAVVRTYFSAYFYAFPSWHRLAERGLPNQAQGESVAVPATGDAIWIGSEGEHSRVLAVPVPNLAPPPTTPSSPPSAGPGDGGSAVAPDEHTEQLQSRALVIGAVALALFVLVAIVIAVRWHRHPHAD